MTLWVLFKPHGEGLCFCFSGQMALLVRPQVPGSPLWAVVAVVLRPFLQWLLGPVLCLHLPVLSLGAGQWSGSWAVVWELGGSLGAGQWSGSWAVVWELGSGLLSQSGVLIRTRPMHVQLGNPLQNSKTTLWSRFPRFFALCDLSDICPFLGSLKGVKESRLGTLSVLVQILVFFPQIGLLQFTFQNLKVAAPSVLSRFSSAVFSGRARVPRGCSA